MIHYYCSGKSTQQVLTDLQDIANISGDKVEILLISWNGNSTVRTIEKHLQEIRGLASETRAMGRMASRFFS